MTTWVRKWEQIVGSWALVDADLYSVSKNCVIYGATEEIIKK